jgi:HPt (histidine-containing phosphotransfer) domain-containing protein
MEVKLKSFDWQLCIELCNHSDELAKELLGMFAQELPVFKKLLNDAYQTKNSEALTQHAHKLHGSCCYCGTPQLKQLLKTFETELAENPDILNPALFEKILAEIDQVSELLNSGYLEQL